MSWQKEETFSKMVDTLVEAKNLMPNSVNRTNLLLESVVYGLGVLILKEDKQVKQTNKVIKRGKSHKVS